MKAKCLAAAVKHLKMRVEANYLAKSGRSASASATAWTKWTAHSWTVLHFREIDSGFDSQSLSIVKPPALEVLASWIRSLGDRISTIPRLWGRGQTQCRALGNLVLSTTLPPGWYGVVLQCPLSAQIWRGLWGLIFGGWGV